MKPKELVEKAMRLEPTSHYAVMCQLANGHTILNTRVHPIEYFLNDELWADCLIRIRELYNFDGILCHKPGRVKCIPEMIVRYDYDAETPTLYLDDGSRIECTRDDDSYYKPANGFKYPALQDLDPDDLLGWAPDSFKAFQASKATLAITDPDEYEDHVFGTIDRVIDRVGDEYSVHGEVRSPFDHFVNLTGLEDGLCALLDDPEKCLEVLEVTTQWSTSLAIAQVRRGAAAIKISSPFAGSSFLSREMYTTFIQPFEGRLAKAVREEGAFSYIHTCGAIGDRLDLICDTGVSGIECLDPPPLGNVDIRSAVSLLKDRIFIKGNVDPVNTLLRGNSDTVRRDVASVLRAADNSKGFILSSACSVAPPAPPDNIKLMADLCHKYVRS